MLDDLRAPGAIEIDARLHDALARLRGAAGVTGAADLVIDELRAVEAGVRTRFEDDLLAVFAARAPVLRESYAIDLSQVIPHSAALRERRARGDLVGIGRLDARTYLCIEPRTRRHQASELFAWDVDSHALTPFDLRSWIEGLVPPGAAPAPFSPRVVPGMLESTQQGRRVRHPTFGEGKALAEIGTGPNRKVKAEFPGVGLKVVLARFLEYLD